MGSHRSVEVCSLSDAKYEFASNLLVLFAHDVYDVPSFYLLLLLNDALGGLIPYATSLKYVA